MSDDSLDHSLDHFLDRVTLLEHSDGVLALTLSHLDVSELGFSANLGQTRSELLAD